MILADTGFWLALANPRDHHHLRALSTLEGLQEGLVTTWPVVTETCHLLVARIGVSSQRRFVEGLVAGGCDLFDLDRGHLPRIAELLGDYSDLPMDLADASLVLLAEELGHGRILSTDQRDFRTYRWKRHEPFENLLIP